MCGIAGIHRIGNRPISKSGKLAAELLLAIEHRGTDATGLLTITDAGAVTIDKSTLPASRFVRDGRAAKAGAGSPRTVLLHTRFATIGAVTKANAHPVVNGPMAAVHNGTIWNHAETFRAIGRKRNATVDSEVIPAVVAHHGWDKAAKALARLDGGMATAIVNVKKPDEVLLARLSGYPLVVYVTRTAVVWASTRDAIERAWKATYGHRPSRGKWIVVDEYELLRVNGSVTRETIARRPRKPVVLPLRKKTGPTKAEMIAATSKWPFGPTSTNPPKGGRKARKGKNRPAGQQTLPGTAAPQQPAHEAREPYMEDAVRDLMRLAGLTRQDAEEEVYGRVITEDADNAVECPDCQAGIVTEYDACTVCGLTWEGMADAASWWDEAVGGRTVGL